MASKPQLHVAIVGAGLGGLAAAISISLAGHRATILEQASELGEVCSYISSFSHPATNNPRSEPAYKSHPTPPPSSADSVSSPKLKLSLPNPIHSSSARTKTGAFFLHNRRFHTVKRHMGRRICIFTERITMGFLYRGRGNWVYRLY